MKIELKNGHISVVAAQPQYDARISGSPFLSGGVYRIEVTTTATGDTQMLVLNDSTQVDRLIDTLIRVRTAELALKDPNQERLKPANAQ